MNVREFFWPMLEKEDHPSEESVPGSDTALKIEDENLEMAFQLKSSIADAEEDRRKSVETKAALLLSTISLASSIVVAANTLVIVNKEFSIAGKISVFISFLLTVYTIRTVWFAIRALERGAYNVLTFKDINVEGSKTEYLRSIIMTLHKKTVSNQSTINSKVDWLTLSQEYYKRSLVIISIYALGILCYSFINYGPKNTEIQNKSSKNAKLPKTEFSNLPIQKININ